MIKHTEINAAILRQYIRQGIVCLGGNGKLGIYGTLHCRSGKRMKKSNRVFFMSQEEAAAMGYRPCGHCLKQEYLKWKHGAVQH